MNNLGLAMCNCDEDGRYTWINLLVFPDKMVTINALGQYMTAQWDNDTLTSNYTLIDEPMTELDTHKDEWTEEMQSSDSSELSEY
jgi:hypothetical protein